MVASCALFAAMSALIHYLATRVSSIEIVFFRNLFGLAVLLPFVLRKGLGPLRTQKFRLYFARSVIGLASMFAWFAALGMMPIAEAVALNFTVPLFAIVCAVLLLGEKVGLHRWSATAVGFGGVLIVLRPGLIEFSPGAALAIGAAVGFAVSMTLIKMLSRSETPSTIVFYQGLIMTPLALVPAFLVWRTPSLAELGMLSGLGAIATLAHLALARAFSLAEASAIVPLDFTRLPFVAAFGYFLFGEPADVWTWVGAAVIVASTIYIARRDALKGRTSAALAQAHDPLRPAG